MNSIHTNRFMKLLSNYVTSDLSSVHLISGTGLKLRKINDGIASLVLHLHEN